MGAAASTRYLELPETLDLHAAKIWAEQLGMAPKDWPEEKWEVREVVFMSQLGCHERLVNGHHSHSFAASGSHQRPGVLLHYHFTWLILLSGALGGQGQHFKRSFHEAM